MPMASPVPSCPGRSRPSTKPRMPSSVRPCLRVDTSAPLIPHSTMHAAVFLGFDDRSIPSVLMHFLRLLIRQLNWMKRAKHCLRVPLNHAEKGRGGGVRQVDALLPVPQRADRDLELARKFLLRHAQPSPDQPWIRRAAHASEVFRGQRRSCLHRPGRCDRPPRRSSPAHGPNRSHHAADAGTSESVGFVGAYPTSRNIVVRSSAVAFRTEIRRRHCDRQR